MITKIKKYIFYFVANICVLLGLCSLINCISFDDLVVSNRNVINHALEELSKETAEEASETSYTNYLAKYSNVETKVVYQNFTAATTLSSNNIVLSKEESYGYNSKTVKLENKQTADFILNVEAAGLYEIYIDYYFCDSSINDVEANFKINHEYPYYEARQVLFKADWVPVTKQFDKDRYNNEIIPSSKKEFKLQEWVTPFGYSVLLLVTSIILIIPASSGILGDVNNWSFIFDNILPYQSFLYHGCLVFVPMYMILSGFYKPKWIDIYKSITVLTVCGLTAFTLNYLFEGSGADFMMLRYGNGNPFASLLQTKPLLYYVLMVSVAFGGSSLVLSLTILVQKYFNNKNIVKVN